MCMSAKVPATVRLAKQALIEDKCVVVGLQSTGEARTEEAVTKYVRISYFMFSPSIYYLIFVVLIGLVFESFLIPHPQ